MTTGMTVTSRKKHGATTGRKSPGMRHPASELPWGQCAICQETPESRLKWCYARLGVERLRTEADQFSSWEQRHPDSVDHEGNERHAWFYGLSA